MHIITGLIVAGLVGRKKKKGSGRLVSMFRTGPVQTVHWLPGRVRFQAAMLAENGEARVLVEDKLGRVEGVDSVRVNPALGTVLINYREEAVSPELLFSALVRLLGLDDEIGRTPEPVVVRELRSVVDSLNRVVYEQTRGLVDFWTAFLIVLTAVGLKKVFTEGARTLPTGFTLLWWATTALAARGRG
jgi:copper chaperone CopZ